MRGKADKADAHRGARIRALRKALEWNQADLAEKIGVDQSTVSDIEHGSSFSAELLMRIANALGTSPTLIMEGEDTTFWPFKRVAMAEFLALEAEERGYVEGVLARELERISLEPTEADIQSARASHIRMKKPATKRRAA